MEKRVETTLKTGRFLTAMIIELEHNKHKGSILDWQDFDNIIAELEYHKAKIFMAIRQENNEALREYIADTANILFALGNKFKLYEDYPKDTGITWELNKKVLISPVAVDKQSTEESLP